MRTAASLALWAFANAAGAQLSGTASVVSDYRYRGITLSDQKPALQAGLNFDFPEGWYAGAFGSTVRLAPPAGAGVQGIAFAGIASRLPSGPVLEAGAHYVAFTGASYDDYGELFVGAATDDANARLFYSPHYFGQGSNAVYAELNASRPLAGPLRFVVHVGFLRARYPTYYGNVARNVVDGRVGLGADFGTVHVELAWVGVSEDEAGYRITGSNSPNTVVLTLSLAF